MSRIQRLAAVAVIALMPVVPAAAAAQTGAKQNKEKSFYDRLSAASPRSPPSSTNSSGAWRPITASIITLRPRPRIRRSSLCSKAKVGRSTLTAAGDFVDAREVEEAVAAE